MKLNDLLAGIDAKILTPRPPRDTEISRIYAGDRISDLIIQGGAETLLVSNLTGSQILRVAELMDVPAICLLNGVVPEPGSIGAAGKHCMALLVSPFGMFETCGRLYERFAAAGDICP